MFFIKSLYFFIIGVIMSIKILICDDDALIRESLKIILSMDEELRRFVKSHQLKSLY